jgi:hypothetical protein
MSEPRLTPELAAKVDADCAARVGRIRGQRNIFDFDALRILDLLEEVAALRADRKVLAAEVQAWRLADTCSVAGLPLAAARTYSTGKATDEAGALSRVEGGAA